jgi:hypothetical protein
MSRTLECQASAENVAELLFRRGAIRKSAVFFCYFLCGSTKKSNEDAGRQAKDRNVLSKCDFNV